MRQVERWARKTQIAKILSFFDGLPRFIHVPKPLLLGSNNEDEILVVADMTTSRVRGVLANLDEPFNPHLRLQCTLGGKRRDKPIRALASIYQELRKGFPELCLLKGNGPCGQKIVQAHSIQKALFKKHAKNGHIYLFEVFTGKHDSEKRLWPELIGINEATTFSGFCDVHDSQTFSPIDNSPFLNIPEHKFLYHYRAFAQTYYGRAHKFRVVESAFKELAAKVPAAEIESLAEKVRSNRQDVSELEPKRRVYQEQLRAKSWPDIEGYAFEGEPMPDILMTEYFGPRKNFQGRIIQDCKSLAPLRWVSMTVSASNDRAVFLLCGEKGCPILRELADSFRKVAPTARTRAILTYVFCHFENFILLPKWWESLSKDVQLQFVNAYAGRYYPRELPDTCDWKLKEIASQG